MKIQNLDGSLDTKHSHIKSTRTRSYFAVHLLVNKQKS